jgi:hypothetical protein
MEYLKPDVIAHASPVDGREWHPVIILLRRDDAGRLAVGINAALRAVARSGEITNDANASEMQMMNSAWGLLRDLSQMAPETRRVMAEVALALDVRLVAVPNQTGAQDLKAQSRSARWSRLYDAMADDINPDSKAFNEEPGSLYARCGHKKVAEVGGRIRCGKADCPNYVRKALAEWEEENGAAQPGQGAN